MRFTGRGTSGSWQIRGVQLGQAVGAEVIPKAEAKGLTVMVKRGGLRRVVWDVVDAYGTAGNSWSREQCFSWLDSMVRKIGPIGIVAATQRMAEDCRKYGVPVLWLPHHARPGLERNPIRPLRVIGYEGGEQYITKWRPAIERECQKRGLTFVVNPTSLSDLDIVLALRDQTGYAARNWKSNVKLANAQASGTPIICSREAGYTETASGAEVWADTEEELSAGLDALTSCSARRDASEVMRSVAPMLGPIARTYKEWLLSKF